MERAFITDTEREGRLREEPPSRAARRLALRASAAAVSGVAVADGVARHRGIVPHLVGQSGADSADPDPGFPDRIASDTHAAAGHDIRRDDVRTPREYGSRDPPTNILGDAANSER